jgi:hypothetical protein
MLPDVFKFSNKWFSWDHPLDSETNALNSKAWICLATNNWRHMGGGVGNHTGPYWQNWRHCQNFFFVKGTFSEDFHLKKGIWEMKY